MEMNSTTISISLNNSNEINDLIIPGNRAEIGGLVARELPEKIVNFSRLDIFREAGDEKSPDLVVQGMRGAGKGGTRGRRRVERRRRDVV